MDPLQAILQTIFNPQAVSGAHMMPDADPVFTHSQPLLPHAGSPNERVQQGFGDLMPPRPHVPMDGPPPPAPARPHVPSAGLPNPRNSPGDFMTVLRHMLGFEDDTLPPAAKPMSGTIPPGIPTPRQGGAVPPSNRWWGDNEAEAAGLYEPASPAMAFAQGDAGGGEGGGAGVPMPRPRPSAPAPSAGAAPAPAGAPAPNLMDAFRQVFASGQAPNGPFNVGPGDPYTVAPPMTGPRAPNTAAPGGLGGTLATALRDIAVGMSAVDPRAPAIKALAQGYAGSVGAGEKRAADARKTAGEDSDRAFKRRQHEDTMDYRNRALDKGKFDFFPGTGPGPDGKDVEGIWKVNKNDGTRTFEPGGTMRSRTGTGAAAREPAPMQIARAYIEANRAARAKDPSIPEMTMDQALDRARRAPRDQEDRNTRERLASAAARAEQEEHLRKYESQRAGAAPFDMAAALNKWRQYYRLDGTPGTPKPGAPAGPKTPGQRTTAPPPDVDVDGSIAEARRIIEANPDKRDAIIQYLEENGITPPDDL